MELLLNLQVMMNFIFAAVNVLLFATMAVKVYGKDSQSVVNRMFSLGAAFGSVAFLVYPFGWLFLHYDAIFVTMRVVFLMGYASGTMISWCSRVLYDGEAMWNRTQNLILYGGFLLIVIIGVLSPDAILLVRDPLESEYVRAIAGPLLSLAIFSTTTVILIIMLYAFGRTYYDFRNEDKIVAYQTRMLTLGTISLGLCMISGFLSMAIFGTPVSVFVWYGSMGFSIFVMSRGFTKDASLLKLKITSELRRMMVALSKGRAAQAEAHLMYLKSLVAREQSVASTVRMLVLEAMIRIYQSKLVPAKESLEKARYLAESGNLTNLRNAVDTHLEHLKVHERAAMISESVQASVSYENGIDDLDRALAYLDEMISIRETDNESYA